MAVAFYRAGQVLGWLPQAPNATSTQALSAAATWCAISFIPDAARTLSAVRVFVSAIAGTLAGTDITCDLYDSTGTTGAPGASVEAGKVPTATITASGWYDFTGFTTVLVAGQTYWLVFKNVNAVQATNNCTFRVVTGVVFGPLTGSTASGRFVWSFATSANSGSTWSLSLGSTGVRVSYADGSYDGMPASSVAAAGVGDGVYSARESGVKFTSPPNGVLKVAGLAIFVTAKTGTPTGSIRLGLWTGITPSNLAYTQSIPLASPGTQWIYAYFSSVQTLQPGTITRITLAETTQSDASGNRFNNREVIWDTDSNSTILLPWEGTCVKTYFDGSSTWTDTAGSIFGHALLLDTAGEFEAGASGGVLLNPGMTGGFQRSN